MIIYKATNKINGKCYIGQTIKTLNIRKTGHYSSMRFGSQLKFHKALRKYDKEDFQWEVIEKCSNSQELDKMEMFYIKECKSLKNGYNNCPGGNSHSEETRKKIAKGNTGKRRKFTPEQCKRISEAHKGIKPSKECIRKRTIANTGKKRTKQTKEMMKKSAIGNVNGSKEWSFVWNDEKITIKNLVKFCKVNDYPYQRAKYRIKRSIKL
jgi:group I intron endonuclease